MKITTATPNDDLSVIRTFRMTVPMDAAIARIASHDGHGVNSQTIRDAIDTYVDARSAADGVDYSAAASESAPMAAAPVAAGAH